jgi:parvulin-like peptidyl-prolyl isomerase
MVDEFQQAVWAAKLRTVTGPVESPFGWHLIWVDSTREVQGRPKFEDMKRRTVESHARSGRPEAF